MQIRYQMTEQDFRDGLTAHQNRSFFSRWSRRYILAILAFTSVLAIALLIHEPSAQTFRIVLPIFGMAVVWVLLFFVLPRWAARKQFQSQPAAQSTQYLDIDESGLRARCDLISSESAWGTYIRWRETERVFVLYSSNVKLSIIPKRAFTGEQMEEFRTLLAEKVAPK